MTKTSRTDYVQVQHTAIEVALRLIKQRFVLEINRRLTARHDNEGYGGFRQLEEFERANHLLGEMLSDDNIDIAVEHYTELLGLDKQARFTDRNSQLDLANRVCDIFLSKHRAEIRDNAR